MVLSSTNSPQPGCLPKLVCGLFVLVLGLLLGSGGYRSTCNLLLLVVWCGVGQCDVGLATVAAQAGLHWCLCDWLSLVY